MRARANRRALAWLRVPPDRSIPRRIRALWREPRRRLGFIPNIFRVFALRPEHLVRWWAYYDHLMRRSSGLTRLQREMIAVVVSSANRCRY